eukprot:1145159-Pelagomonas_calceolata.AAC.7
MTSLVQHDCFKQARAEAVKCHVLVQVIEMAMSDKKDKLWPMLEKLGIANKLKHDDRELNGKPLMKRIMQAWLPANVALMEMIVYHLPSPARVRNLKCSEVKGFIKECTTE